LSDTDSDAPKKKTMKKQTPATGFLDPAKDNQEVKIDGCPLQFNHLSKVYWPEDGITKRDMFNYYDQVAEYMVPYLKDRPMSLNRFPNGIHGPSFYQKDVKDKAPDAGRRCRIRPATAWKRNIW
jgi:bifunctional non-homologous end joining protein LigD